MYLGLNTWPLVPPFSREQNIGGNRILTIGNFGSPGSLLHSMSIGQQGTKRSNAKIDALVRQVPLERYCLGE